MCTGLCGICKERNYVTLWSFVTNQMQLECVKYDQIFSLLTLKCLGISYSVIQSKLHNSLLFV